MEQDQSIQMAATLKSVREQSNGKYVFRVVAVRTSAGSPLEHEAAQEYRFLLSREKALKIANHATDWPKGVTLRLRGQTIVGQDGSIRVRGLKYVKILSVDGYDVQSWAQRNQSPTVAPDVLKKAQRAIDETEEEVMRHRAPPDPAPLFKNAKEAYEKAMTIIRRQVRLKKPKLSKSEIWAVRDALNILKEKAGL